MTGSVDQHGNVQAIGGVNQKIEGYFDICNMQGLTGQPGRADPQIQCSGFDAARRCCGGRT